MTRVSWGRRDGVTDGGRMGESRLEIGVPPLELVAVRQIRRGRAGHVHPSERRVHAISRLTSPPTRSAMQLQHTLTTHKGSVLTAAYNTGSAYLLTGGQDRLIKLWNPSSGSQVQTYQGHGYEVLGLCWSVPRPVHRD